MNSAKIIDVTDPATRHAFQQGIKRLWEQTPAPVRFIDNAGIHRSAGKSQPWSSYCANIEEIRKIGESMGSLQIFNLSLHVGEMSDEETSQLIKVVGKGGILLEMPWHENIRTNPAATGELGKDLEKAYRSSVLCRRILEGARCEAIWRRCFAVVLQLRPGVRSRRGHTEKHDSGRKYCTGNI